MNIEKQDLPEILIVEDSLTQAEILQHLLESENYRVICVSNGMEALTIMDRNKPNVVVSDIMMPQMNGYELCRAIKNNAKTEHIPVILLTSLSEPTDIISSLESGADYFIVKSGGIDILLDKIRLICENNEVSYENESTFDTWFQYNHQKYHIDTSLSKLINILLTTYEIAVNQNKILQETQDQLRSEIIRRAELDIKLKKAKLAAEHANQAKSSFLATMSHEIRTPMNAILGFSQLMLRDPQITALQKERLETISNSGEHLLSLINDVLDITKIEAGRIITHFTNFDFLRLLRELEAMFKVRTDTQNLRLLLEIDKDVEPNIFSDEGKIRQILINLISNAIKFTHEGGIAIRVKMTPENDVKLILTVEVEDTGVGIKSSEFEKLFKIFEQTESGLKTGGTGLGLALSQQFAHLLDGDILVKSDPQKGSCFTLRIPVAYGDNSKIASCDLKRRIKSIRLKDNSKKILIVDDKYSNRAFLSEIMSMKGIEIKEAQSGEEAVKINIEWKPDIVLMDLKMEGMDGYEATKLIKKADIENKTDVIFVTATAFEDDLTVLLDSGASTYIRKPFKITDIYEILGQYMNLEFIYEDESEAPKSEVPMNFSGLIDKIPETLIQEMIQAALNAQLDHLVNLIQSVKAIDLQNGAFLEELANNFQYDALIKLLKGEGE